MPEQWPLILAYHHLHPARSSRYVMAVDRFEHQLGTMLDDGFVPIGLDEAVARGPNGDGSAPPRTFTITFDDGLESLATLALPVLDRLGLAGFSAVFVPTGWVGADNGWRTDPTLLQRLMPWGEVEERLLGWDELADVARAGIRIESHGNGHLAMNGLTYGEATADLETSRRLLAEHGFETRYFAWPYGWHSEESLRAARDVGFDAAFSVKWGGRDRFEIRRIPVYGTDRALTQRLKLSGRYFGAFDTAARLAGKRRYVT